MAMRIPEEAIDAGVGTEPTGVSEFVHDAFRAHVTNGRFSCVAAKSALHNGNYRVGVYGSMDDLASAKALAVDLERWVDDQASLKPGFRTFAAAFDDPTPRSERAFEAALWRVLQSLHDVDRRSHEWDPSVSADPDDPDFSFSFAGTAFFIVGLHPTSARFARRFAFPTLVFNLHEQFEELRRSGRYERMQSVIRTRDVQLQGSINENLSEFGESSEARQYSGRRTERTWKCPFVARDR